MLKQSITQVRGWHIGALKDVYHPSNLCSVVGQNHKWAPQPWGLSPPSCHHIFSLLISLRHIITVWLYSCASTRSCNGNKSSLIKKGVVQTGTKPSRKEHLLKSWVSFLLCVGREGGRSQHAARQRVMHEQGLPTYLPGSNLHVWWILLGLRQPYDKEVICSHILPA